MEIDVNNYDKCLQIDIKQKPRFFSAADRAEVDIDLVSTWFNIIVLFVMPAVIKMHAPLILMIYIWILITANDSFIHYWNLSFEELQIIFWCFTYIWPKFWKYVYMYMYTIIYIYSYTSLPPLFTTTVIPKRFDNLWI